MVLKYLLEDLENETLGNTNIVIEKIEYDSKKIGKNDIFVAIIGYKQNGNDYIIDAIKNGAIAIIINKEDYENVLEKIKQEVNIDGITIILVSDTRIALAKIAAKYYGYPADKLKMIGITGTKGKTTTAYMIRDILVASKRKCGLISTIAIEYFDIHLDASRTTPESLDLQKILKDMVDSGIEYVVMEVSSHALVLNRTYGIHFEIGVFTNLSREHLDFHNTMDEYLNAKAKLFDSCSYAIINADDIYTPKLLKMINCKVAKYGIDNSSNISAMDVRINNNYVDFKMFINKHFETIRVSIPGRYSVYNALAAIAVTSVFGAQMEDILQALSNIKVPGRSEIVPIGKTFAVLIDYAHTPSSLEAIITNTKKYVKGRVITVFGCGGNRDKGKRFEMGKISGTYSDFTIITTDNPRDEMPKDIATEIENGIKETKGMYKIILDRKEAIKFAMRIAWKNDTVIIAGKGHETYQELKQNKKIHFDDREEVCKIAKTMPEKDEIKYTEGN